jgi:hypothetical protein
MRGLKTSAALLLATATMASAQFATNWVAFNDHNLNTQPAPGTATNLVTLYHLGGGPTGAGSGGPLTNYYNGQQLVAALIVTGTGGNGPDDFGASNDPNAGSPAYNLFNGIVDVGGSGVGVDEGIIGLRSSETNVVTMTFSNLDTSQRYLFRGTSVRGNNYVDRWAIYTIQAASFVDAHVDGSANQNIFTADTFAGTTLTNGQVALNSGENRAGSLVGWNDIVPNPDGTFSIIEQQYTGTAPFGNPSAGPYGYGMNAIMLAEIFTGPPSPPSIVVQPVGVTNTEGQVAIVRVIATGTPPLTYQWYKGTPPSGAVISGATRSALSVTNIAGSGKAWSAPSDSGQYYVIVTGALAPPATSSAATVQVNADTNPPVFLYATCNPTNLNLITLTLSEALEIPDGRITDNFNWTILDVAGGGPDPGVVTVDYTPGSTTITFTTQNARNPSRAYRITYNSFDPLIDRSEAHNAMPIPSSILINCVETELIAMNGVWRYEDSDVDPGTSWKDPGFNDGAGPWIGGPGPFDGKKLSNSPPCRNFITNAAGGFLYGISNPVGTCIRLDSPITGTNQATVYFRTRFFFGGDPTTAFLLFNGKFDDGAIVYLNGSELERVGVAAAPTVVGHNDFASRGVGDGDGPDTAQFIFPPVLRRGDNVLAVALHQQSLTSSDLTMGLQVVSLSQMPLTAPPPTLTIALEGANVRIKWIGGGTLQYTDTMNNAPVWQDQTTGQVGPGEYLVPHDQAHRFYSLRQ